MKLCNLKISVVVFLLLSLGATLQAQEEKSEFHRYVGIGLSTPLFQIHELPVDAIPGKRFLLAVDPIEYLRVEFHCATYKHDIQKNITFYPSGKNFLLNLKEDSKLFGGGIFGVYPMNKFKFIAGIRYSRDNYDLDEIDYTEGDPMVVTDHGKINITTGVIGAEYYFSKWFSLGTELSVMHMRNSVYNALSPDPVTTTRKGVYEAGLAFTFYPF